MMIISQSYPLGVLYNLKTNCGPIHKRRCGPACVTISTCDNQRSSRSSGLSVSIWLVSKFKLLSMTRSLISQLSAGNGGDISICEFDF